MVSLIPLELEGISQRDAAQSPTTQETNRSEGGVVRVQGKPEKQAVPPTSVSPR